MRKFVGIVAFHGLLLCSGLVSAASNEAAEKVAMGKKLLEQGKVEAAIGEFQKAAVIDPQYGAAPLNLGSAYERAQRYDQAVEAYRRAVELEPHNFYARNNLGVLYDKKGMYDQAIVEFQNALSNDPSNSTALKNLETAKKNKAVIEEREAQIKRAEQAIEARPKDPKPAYQLSRLHASYGNRDAAMEWLGKAMKLGFTDLAYVKADPAFVKLREERDFQMLLLPK